MTTAIEQHAHIHVINIAKNKNGDWVESDPKINGADSSVDKIYRYSLAIALSILGITSGDQDDFSP